MSGIKCIAGISKFNVRDIETFSSKNHVINKLLFTNMNC